MNQNRRKHRSPRLRALALLFLTCTLALPLASVCVSGEEAAETLIFPVNAVNGTRWSDTLIVYRNKPTTEQNQYGWNVVVDASGKVIEKIPAGDEKGKDLAIPAGGMVVSGCDDPGKNAYDAAELGSNVYYDAFSSRVLISQGEIDPFYEYTLQANSLNGVRYSNTIVIYNRGASTETNGYGYEVCVGADGQILSVGGNDNAIPEGGYVISAIERADMDTLKTYFIPGAFCERNGMKVTVRYEASMMMTTVEAALAAIRQEMEEARGQLRLVDYEGIEKQLAKAEQTASDRASAGGFSTFAERDAMLAELTPIRLQLTEREPVQIRSTWYTPLEWTEEGVKETVQRMADTGLNQVRLGLPNGYHTYVPMPEALDDGEGGSIVFPFRADSRTKNLDLLALYADACKEAGIELVVSIPVFHAGDGARYKKEWLASTNKETANDELFFSPANDEYRAYFKAYIRYIITHYAIDGVEFDYIRYPYFDGSIDYGYDDAAKEKFAAQTGLPASTVDEIGEKLRNHPQWNTWVEFKMGLITEYLRELRSMIDELRPDLYVTAAVANDTSHTAYFQDSRRWMTEALVDGIYPMAYSEGVMRASTESFSAFLTDRTFLVMGCGAYQSYTMDEVLLQAKQASLYGADGIAYFEWGAYDSHGYAGYLRETIYEKDALSFTMHESESVRLLVEQAKARFALYGTEGTGADALFAKYDGGELSLADLVGSLQAEIAGNDFLYRDLDRALRIEAFSREEFRDEVRLLPTDQSAIEPSDAAPEAPAEGDSAGESDSPPSGSRTGQIVAITASAVAVAAMGVCVVAALLKKRRK